MERQQKRDKTPCLRFCRQNITVIPVSYSNNKCGKEEERKNKKYSVYAMQPQKTEQISIYLITVKQMLFYTGFKIRH